MNKMSNCWGCDCERFGIIGKEKTMSLDEPENKKKKLNDELFDGILDAIVT